MKKFFILTVVLLLPLRLFAINPQSLKKYPYQLLTNDHGILNEANLKRYADDIVVQPFTWKITGFDYWQCFPTKNVTIWYEQRTYDPYDKVIPADPHITVNIARNKIHDYTPRRTFSLDYAKEKVTRWKKILKNQEYVCIGGAFAGTYKKTKNGNEIIEHGWIFENLKTKQGCDSYFSGWCA